MLLDFGPKLYPIPILKIYIFHKYVCIYASFYLFAALRQHLHVPRASAANVCPDEESLEDKETEKRDENKEKENLRYSCRYKHFKSKLVDLIYFFSSV